MTGAVDPQASSIWAGIPHKGIESFLLTDVYSRVTPIWEPNKMIGVYTSEAPAITEAGGIFYGIPSVDRVYYRRDDNGLHIVVACESLTRSELETMIDLGIKLDLKYPDEDILVDIAECLDTDPLPYSMKDYILVKHSQTYSTIP